MQYEVQKLADYLWELPQTGGMRVPARIYATEKMFPEILCGNAPQQAANVAHLPGIVKAPLAKQEFEVARSLWDPRSLLVDLDIEYVNFDFPAEPYLHPDRAFALQENVCLC